MSRNKKFSEKEISEIKNWKKKISKKHLYRKLEVLDYVAKGMTYEKVSELTDYSLKGVYSIVRAYRSKGIKHFKEENRKGGYRRNLSEAQEEALMIEFEEKAIAGQVVSLSEVKRRYEEVRGKETANSTFYDFLKRVKWRRVMPRGEHPKKATEAEIEASKKLTFS